MLIILAIFQGCKDDEEVGLNVLPPSDQLYTDFSDTSTVVTGIVEEDSIRTDELSLQLIGSDQDPVFGLSTASVYTQVVLQGTPTFGTSPVADSIILTLVYEDYFGDTNTVQTFNVFKLTEDIHTDSAYYSNRNFSYDPAVIGSISFAPKPNTQIDSPAVSARIRISLDKAIADSIVALDPANYASNSAWISYFKGIFIQAQAVASPGAISYFDFFESKLTLYFHNTTDTNSYDFSLSGGRVNNFTHNFGNSHVGSQLQSPQSGDSVNYLLSMDGIKTKISFPYLKHFLDSGSILINRAELKIDATPVNVPYKLPGRLLLVSINEDGESVLPIDYYETSGYYGGELNTSSSEYTFNIARHLQQYLNGTVTTPDFYLIISGSGIEATRAVIKSGNNISRRMTLSLFYTKLN